MPIFGPVYLFPLFVFELLLEIHFQSVLMLISVQNLVWIQLYQSSISLNQEFQSGVPELLPMVTASLFLISVCNQYFVLNGSCILAIGVFLYFSRLLFY